MSSSSFGNICLSFTSLQFGWINPWRSLLGLFFSKNKLLDHKSLDIDVLTYKQSGSNLENEELTKRSQKKRAGQAKNMEQIKYNNKKKPFPINSKVTKTKQSSKYRTLNNMLRTKNLPCFCCCMAMSIFNIWGSVAVEEGHCSWGIAYWKTWLVAWVFPWSSRSTLCW